MHPKLKQFLLISAKNAVNAILTNSAILAIFHQHMSDLRTRHEWGIIGWMTLSCVAIREGTVWLPKLLAWSNSATNGVSDLAVANALASTNNVVTQSPVNPPPTPPQASKEATSTGSRASGVGGP